MLWCTWVRRPLSFWPVTDATSSPNSATAAARTPSRSYKAEARSPARPTLEPPLQSDVGPSTLSRTPSSGLQVPGTDLSLPFQSGLGSRDEAPPSVRARGQG